MPRAGLSPQVCVDAAVALIDERGEGELTLAAVAARTGVAAPSLYKHVRGLKELRLLVAARVLHEMTERLTTAVIGRSGDDAVAALLRAYRGYVMEYPARYAMVPPSPLDVPELVTPGRRMLDVILTVLRAYGLTGSAAIHATRCLRAAAHGFASLEAAGGFGLPQDLDTTYELLIRTLITSLNNGSFAERQDT